MNHDLIPPGPQPLTMSSREIAELLEVRHDNVKRTVERLAERGVIEFPPTEDIPTATKPVRVYHLVKRDSYVVVAQLSPEFTARLVDRWQELEEKATALPDFTNPAEAARAWADQVERVEKQRAEIEHMREDVVALDRISTADGSMCVTDAAKALQMRPKDLFSWLSQNGWIYKRTGAAHYLGYQSKTTAGLLEHKVTTVLRADGSEKVTEQVRITSKGLTTLAKLIKPSASAA